MKLNDFSLARGAQWAQAGIRLPAFDRAAMRAKTAKAPKWIHFGAGNIFRAFLAMCQQALLEKGASEAGVIAVDYDDMIEAVFRPHDDLTLLVTLCPDGRMDKAVVGSVAQSLGLGEMDRLRALFSDPGLQMVSFTVTEKGYRLTDAEGAPRPEIERDMRQGPDAAQSYMGRVAALLNARFETSGAPIAMVSMDNCAHNGDRLRAAIGEIALAWARTGLVSQAFVDALGDPRQIAFPWTMIDKITPRPDPEVRAKLLATGFEDVQGVTTRTGAYAAPFVNAERAQYLVIEDCFPNGRPPLEEAGVLFADRETVNKAEKMKVCACLNPAHTALAIMGCLLGFEKISDEMRDADLREMVRRLGYLEGMPVAPDPGILSPEAFFKEALSERIPNAFLPDTPQRIASDTSQKLSVRFGETIKAYIARPEMDVGSLQIIPLVLAAWCRYLMGVDDQGNPFTPSPDPLYEKLAARLVNLRPGDAGPFHAALRPILSDATLFGVDLYAAGLGARVEEDFERMMEGPGAVRRALKARIEW